jgi:hypothetical protein
MLSKESPSDKGNLLPCALTGDVFVVEGQRNLVKSAKAKSATGSQKPVAPTQYKHIKSSCPPQNAGEQHGALRSA